MASYVWLCLAAVVLSQLLTAESCRFIVSAPNVFRVPWDNVVHVTLSGADAQVRLSIRELDGVSATANVVGNSKEATAVTLKLTYNNTRLLTKRDNNVTLVATFTGPGCNVEKTSNVIVTYRACMVLIQTDKPLYTPTDARAHIRFFPLRPDLRPLVDEARCYVMTDDDVIIEDFGDPIKFHMNLDGQQIRGMAVRSFALRDIYPRPGMYKVSCFCGQKFPTQYSSVFQVDDYVLPEYSATIVKATSCVLPGKSEITVQFKSKYTFGSGLLDGHAIFRTGVVGRLDIPEMVSPLISITTESDASVLTSKVQLPVLEGGQNQTKNGDVLYVKLQVTESGSDVAAEDIWTATKYAEEAVVPFLKDIPKYFLPGGALNFLACSRTCTNEPVSGHNIKLKYRIDGGANAVEQDKEGITDDEKGGCTPISISLPLDSTRLELEAMIDSPNAKATATKTVMASTLCSGPGTNVRATLKRTDSLQSTRVGKKVIVQLDVAGITNRAVVIFQLNSVLGTVRVNRTEQTLENPAIAEFQVTDAMSPRLTVVAYAYDMVDETKCAVATLSVDVAFNMTNKAKVVLNNGGYLDLRLDVNKRSLVQGHATPNSTVRFLAVDEALMILKREAGLPDTFTREVIQGYVESFSPVCLRGNGKSSADTFMNSGISIISNIPKFVSSQRMHLGCGEEDGGHRRARRSTEEEGAVTTPQSRFQCWIQPCTQLQETLITEYCKVNEHQTADGGCREEAAKQLGFTCNGDYFTSLGSNATHSWCNNAVGTRLPDTTVEGHDEFLCWDYERCLDSSVFEPPLGCNKICEGVGFQRAVNGCSICKCNEVSSDFGKAWALSATPCRHIENTEYSFRFNYTVATMKCACFNAIEQGAVYGRSYCCPPAARSLANAAASNSGAPDDGSKIKFIDPNVITTRKDFRETWLLDDEVIADSNGNAFLTPDSVPQSLTTYRIIMTAMHPLAGFGLDESTLVVTRRLQVKTTVASRVRLNEDFNVRCTVRNLYEYALPIQFELSVSEELCTVTNTDKVTIGQQWVQRQSLWSQNFLVKALEETLDSLAYVRCRVLSERDGDADEREVMVEPEGELVHASVNIPLHPNGEEKCPDGICQNGGTPFEGLLCCYCECPPTHTGANCTDPILARAVAGGANPFHIVYVTPRIVFLAPTEHLKVTCSAESAVVGMAMDDTVTFSWRRLSGRGMPPRTRVAGRLLSIADVLVEDQDDYVCSVWYRNITVTATVRVVIGSLCPYNGSVSDNPCALRFFKPGNAAPSLVALTRNSAKKEQTATVDLSPPSEVTPNSLLCRVMIRGYSALPLPPLELIDPAILGGMILMPFGCGEQTMMRLAPLVYAMNYIDDSGYFNAPGKLAQRNNGIRYIESGVLRMEQKRNGKCYAVWASQRQPSIWLGAFVTRTLCLAKSWKVPKDPRVLSNAIDCLLGAQEDDGGIVERGPVYHKDMTGGTDQSKKVPMTAFVLLSLVECNEAYDFNLETKISFAVRYLKTSWRDVLSGTSNFQLALTTYALCRAGVRSEAREGIAKLLERASKDAAGTFWKKASNDANRYDVSAGSLAIETTAYVLLALTCMGERQKATPVVEYMEQKYTPRGGFASTQETVVAINAMIAFSKINEDRQGTANFTVAVQAVRAGVPVLIDETTVTNDNYNVRKTIPFRGVNTLRLVATGQGKGQAQVACDYRLLKTCDSCPFALTVNYSESERSDETFITVTVLVAWRADYLYVDQNTMFIVHLDFFTGFDLTDGSKGSLTDVPEVDQVERRNQSVVIYLNHIPTAEEGILSLKIIGKRAASFQAADSVPAVVRVYDYYDPDKRCEVFYARHGASARPESLCSAGRTISTGLEDGHGRCACVARTCPNCNEANCAVGAEFVKQYSILRAQRASRGKQVPAPCAFSGRGNNRLRRVCRLKREINATIDRLKRYSCHDVDYVYLVVLRNVTPSTQGSMWRQLTVKLIDVYKNGSRIFQHHADGTVVRTTISIFVSKACSMCDDALNGRLPMQQAQNKRKFFVFGKDSNPLVLGKGSTLMPYPSGSCLLDTDLHLFFNSLKHHGVCQ